MSVIYLFLDGVGLGVNNPDLNPFTRYATSFLSAPGGRAASDPVPDGWQVIETDAALGLPGLPQSASGQTSLWTGINGPRAMGRHMTGFPGPTLIRIIHEHSILKRFVEAGRRASLMNAYTDAYVDRITARPRLASASTHVQRASGQDLKSMDDLARGDALYMDITHEILQRIFPELGERFGVRSAEERGREFAQMSRNYDLALFEFFITDKAGHEQDWDMAAWSIRTLESFLRGLTSAMDPTQDTLLITSDHGNLEDLSVRTHTKNPVPTFAYGAGAARAAANVRALTDIPPLIYALQGVNVALPAEPVAPAGREEPDVDQGVGDTSVG